MNSLKQTIENLEYEELEEYAAIAISLLGHEDIDWKWVETALKETEFYDEFVGPVSDKVYNEIEENDLENEYDFVDTYELY